MRSMLLAACGAVLALAGGGAWASDASEAIAAVRKFSAAANGTDRAAYAAFCTADAVFIDHVPPYVFHGPTACADEWDAVGRWIEQNRIVASDYGTLAEPAFVDAAGDRVYAVFPVTASATRSGRKEIETGAWTFVLRREAGDWRIAALTWSTFSFAPARDAKSAPKRKH